MVRGRVSIRPHWCSTKEQNRQKRDFKNSTKLHFYQKNELEINFVQLLLETRPFAFLFFYLCAKADWDLVSSLPVSTRDILQERCWHGEGRGVQLEVHLLFRRVLPDGSLRPKAEFRSVMCYFLLLFASHVRQLKRSINMSINAT